MKLSLRNTIGVLSAALVFAACSNDSSLGPTAGPLAGLSQTTANDTGRVDTPAATSGPGHFQGTVLGPSSPGAGNDSLSTAPRIAGVVVTIYQRKAGADTVTAGDAKGSVTTGTDGKFTLPTLPAGDYIVSFVPPANSGYYGAWAFGPLRENSSDFAWWVVLAKK